MLSEPPPRWLAGFEWLSRWILILGLALSIMIQWTMWIALGMELWNPWGMGIGAAISIVQIALLFGRWTPRAETCEVPRREPE